jgi:hypothetical protein
MSLYSKEHIIPVSVFKKCKMTPWKDISPNVQPVHIGLNQFRRNYTFAHWKDHVSPLFLSHYPDPFSSPYSTLSPKLISILHDDFGLESFQFHPNNVVALRSKDAKLFMPLYRQKHLSQSLYHLKSQYEHWLDFSLVIEHPLVMEKWNLQPSEDKERDIDNEDSTTISSSSVQ